MDNIIALRFFLTAVILIAVTTGILAFVYLKFPVSAVVALLAVVITVGAIFLIQRKERAARFNVYYSTVEALGTPINFGNLDAAFERNGTRFEVAFPQGEDSQFFRVNFYLPHLPEKFSVQSRSLAPRFHSDCYVIEDSPLPPEYLVQSTHPPFLQEFLKKRAVLDEVCNYGASFWKGFMISLEDGTFEMVWTPPLAEQVDGFYQICQSAALFHDELKKISDTRASSLRK